MLSARLDGQMLQFQRVVGGSVHDTVSLSSANAGEAMDVLSDVGFVPSGEDAKSEDDDKDANLCPLRRQGAGAGGHFTHGRYATPVEICTRDEYSGNWVGFSCSHDFRKAVLYAKLHAEESEEGTTAERATKGAITTLLDVAEACRARKITIGLSHQYAVCPEFLCSLLYLGFQVVPPRKSPLVNVALLLDFILGPLQPGCLGASDVTGTSDCSTSAVDGDVVDTSADSD